MVITAGTLLYPLHVLDALMSSSSSSVNSSSSTSDSSITSSSSDSSNSSISSSSESSLSSLSSSSSQSSNSSSSTSSSSASTTSSSSDSSYSSSSNSSSSSKSSSSESSSSISSSSPATSSSSSSSPLKSSSSSSTESSSSSGLSSSSNSSSSLNSSSSSVNSSSSSSLNSSSSSSSSVNSSSSSTSFEGFEYFNVGGYVVSIPKQCDLTMGNSTYKGIREGRTASFGAIGYSQHVYDKYCAYLYDNEARTLTFNVASRTKFNNGDTYTMNPSGVTAGTLQISKNSVGATRFNYRMSGTTASFYPKKYMLEDLRYIQLQFGDPNSELGTFPSMEVGAQIYVQDYFGYIVGVLATSSNTYTITKGSPMRWYEFNF